MEIVSLLEKGILEAEEKFFADAKDFQTLTYLLHCQRRRKRGTYSSHTVIVIKRKSNI